MRVWAFDSTECIQQYVGHNNFVYGMTFISSVHEFATCSEDQTVNLWQGNRLFIDFF